MKPYKKPKTKIIELELSSLMAGSPDGSEMGGPTTDPFLAPKAAGRGIIDDEENVTLNNI